MQGKGLWERPVLEGLGSGLLQMLLLSGAAWPGQGPCQGSLWLQRNRVPLLPIPVHVLAPPCPQAWGVLLGAHGLYPSTASGCFPAGSQRFLGAEGV